MSNQPNRADKHDQKRRPDEHFEPFELNNPIPWPIIAIALALSAWGIFTFIYSDMAAEDNQQQAQQTASQPGAEPTDGQSAPNIDGAVLFSSYCSSCHQDNGAGVSRAIPPLAGSSWVLDDDAQTASILLLGINGPITVKGHAYNGRMPTFGDTLDDQEIAAIVSYVRSQWGNDASAISATTVADLRERWSARNSPWQSGAELRTALQTTQAEEANQ